NSLTLAVEHSCRSIAFPNISTGIYGFPKEKAAVIAIETIISFLNNNSFIKKVLLVCFDEENHALVKRELERLSPVV
ncbi:MAG TPA: macro domain-containing protein, partial [Chitinophagaceae bacterium]|nr:macro domain-containing protein [Chitinophagaceae bacterium]